MSILRVGGLYRMQYIETCNMEKSDVVCMIRFVESDLLNIF